MCHDIVQQLRHACAAAPPVPIIIFTKRRLRTTTMSLQFSASRRKGSPSHCWWAKFLRQPAPLSMSRCNENMKVVDVQLQAVPLVAKCMSLLCCPLVFMGTAYTVDQQTEAVVLHLGVQRIERKPGLHVAWPCFRK